MTFQLLFFVAALVLSILSLFRPPDQTREIKWCGLCLALGLLWSSLPR